MRLRIVSETATRRVSRLWQKLHPATKVRPVALKADLERYHFSVLQMLEALAHLHASQRALLLLVLANDEEALRRNEQAGHEIASALRLSRDFYASLTEHSAAELKKSQPVEGTNPDAATG